MPRRLEVGDRWDYKVLYPDSKSYEMTETVQSILPLNGSETYVILRDDAQHISTQYFWITTHWHEIKAFKPHIGNLMANSTVTYAPPIELFRLPFHSGDQWTVTCTAQTVTVIDNKTIDSTSFLEQVRETKHLEEVLTAIGQTQAFKVTVTMNGTLLESAWFSTNLGQVVYAEFYSRNEMVTQTLVGYSLAGATPSVEMIRFSGTFTQSTQTTYRKLYLLDTRLSAF
jgi:hypothetical protein